MLFLHNYLNNIKTHINYQQNVIILILGEI